MTLKYLRRNTKEIITPKNNMATNHTLQIKRSHKMPHIRATVKGNKGI